MAQRLLIDNKLDGGLKDYSRNLMDAGQFYRHENNQPATFSFQVQDIGDADFIAPTRGAYVSFEDDRFESRDQGVPDGVLFTGYVSDDPEPVFLGIGPDGQDVFAYNVTATSEDYLPQIKQLPSKIYVNKTRGFIIRDLVATMFETADIQPLDTSGVRDGGVERLYQTDPSKKFADVLAEFAQADAYRYRALDGRLFYEPEEEVLPGSNDPRVKLIIDAEDPRYTPSNLDLQRIATQIVNDVTVYGEDEPTTLVHEQFVSDGYQGEHRLLFKPYGVTEKVLVEDDFAAPNFDTALWEEEDDPQALTGLGDGSYLQMFEGAFNIVGGTGTPEAPEVWLRSRRGVELTGVIEFRDCEIYFAPGSTGTGLIGGLFSDEQMSLSTCLSGWYADLGNLAIYPVVNGVSQTSKKLTVVVDGNHHYILRRRFEFDIPVGLPVTRRGPRGTEVVFGSDVTRTNGCSVIYSVEQLNITDPQNIVVSKADLFTTRIENIPEFVLYAVVISYDLHAVMNYCKVKRPQQVRLRVNGSSIPVGDFIDGGLASVVVEDERSKLAWYSIPTSTDGPNVPIVVPATTPHAWWKLGDPAGGHSSRLADSGLSRLFPMDAANLITLAPGCPTATVDQARYFPGGTGPVGDYPFGPAAIGPVFGNPTGFSHPSTGGFPVPFTVCGWFKTTATDGPIFSFGSASLGAVDPSAHYIGIHVVNGRLTARLGAPENGLPGSRIVNDGSWHHFAVTHSATPGSAGTTKIYIDGVLDVEGTQTLPSPQTNSYWGIGYDNVIWNSLGGIYVQQWFQGTLDEIQLWGAALSAEEVDAQFRALQSPTGGGGSGMPPPVYNPQTGVTIPPQGSIVDIFYHRAEQAKARIKSTESILAERARFGDDGIRQHTILPDDVFPKPRTSEECQYLGQAFLADRTEHRYEGDYTFQTGERDITRLDLMPVPGDMIPCYIQLGNGEKIDTLLHCTSVSASFMGKGAYEISLAIGPKHRFDEAQRKLLLARKSSLENPEIREKDILSAEVLSSTGYSIPNDPMTAEVVSVTPQTFTVAMNTSDATTGGYGTGEVNSDLPEGVVGYEVRRDDSGWGQGNYVARVASAVFTVNRGQRDRAYFVRPFNAQGNYSRNSALVRVISPLSNNIPVGELDGDISDDAIRLYIPIDRNPDTGGWLVQKGNQDGAILYHGNGIDHRSIVSGAYALVESGRVMIAMPISTGAYTVYVSAYNLLGVFGTGTTFTITRTAESV